MSITFCGHLAKRRLAKSGTQAVSAFAFFLSLAGCGSGLAPSVVSNADAITGNWQLSSTDATASRLPSLSGQLTGSNAQVTGTFHSNSASACVSPTTVIPLTGSAGANNLVTLTGELAGGTLTIVGTLAADGRTLTAATYNVTGGTCAFSGSASSTAQSYTPIGGTYSGSFSDPAGNSLPISVQLMQSLTPDASGNFPLNGSSSLNHNTCFSGLINLSNSVVTGDSFSVTYTDTSKADSVVVTGNLSTDASTLTVTSWVLTGPCTTDSGTGLLTRQ